MLPKQDSDYLASDAFEIDAGAFDEVKLADVPNAADDRLRHFLRECLNQIHQQDGAAVQMNLPLNFRIGVALAVDLSHQMEQHVDEVVLELILLCDDHTVTLAEVVANNRYGERQKLNVVALPDSRKDLLVHVRQRQVLNLVPQFGGNARNVVDDHLVEEPALW